MARHYSEQELEGLIGLDEAIEGLALAFREYADGTALVQPRIPTELGGLRINTMAAVLPALGCCGAKVYTAFRSKFSFVILLFSSEDGRLLATFDAGALTRLRTAAVSALAERYLARPDSRELALFGTGVQAAGHAQALAKTLPIEAIYVVSRDAGRAAAFARAMEALTGVQVAPADAAAAVGRADVIVTATRSAVPLFDGRLMRNGCCLVAVGSARPDAAEIDAAAVARCARVVVESGAQAMHEAGDLIQAAAAGAFSWDRVTELGALVVGRAPGRQSAAEITLFESVGFALEDVAIASIAYTKLQTQGKV